MSDKELDHLDIAVLAAKKAGEIHLKYFNSDLKPQTKSSEFDLVTIADIEAENQIKNIIQEAFPEHNFLGEEGGLEDNGSEYTWIVDPLDGTNNFASGLPIFCVSIGLVKNNEPLIGVIFDPTRNELYYATKGEGAFLNGKPIKVSANSSINKALLITGFYYSRDEKMLNTLEDIKKFFQTGIIGIRRLGSAALDLCYVAAGRATGFWEFELSPWDFAAGMLLVEEAGGKVTNKKGEKLTIDEKNYIVSSNGILHQKMLDILNK